MTPKIEDVRENSGECLARMGIDAKLWAEEFNRVEVKNGLQPTDPGKMIAWFANAIMAGFDEGTRRANGELVKPMSVENIFNFISNLKLDVTFKLDKNKTTPEILVLLNEQVSLGLAKALVAKVSKVSDDKLEIACEALGLIKDSDSHIFDEDPCGQLDYVIDLAKQALDKIKKGRE